MRTQRMNLVEAINLALAGHVINLYSDKASSIQFINNELTITKTADLVDERKTTRRIDGRDFAWLKDEEFHAGDNKSIQGYY